MVARWQMGWATFPNCSNKCVKSRSAFKKLATVIIRVRMCHFLATSGSSCRFWWWLGGRWSGLFSPSGQTDDQHQVLRSKNLKPMDFRYNIANTVPIRSSWRFGGRSTGIFVPTGEICPQPSVGKNCSNARFRAVGAGCSTIPMGNSATGDCY